MKVLLEVRFLLHHPIHPNRHLVSFPQGQGRRGLPIPPLLHLGDMVVLERGHGSVIEVVARLQLKQPVLLQSLHRLKAHPHQSVLQLHELVCGNGRISPWYHLSRPM